jgi:hypothetical protein
VAGYAGSPGSRGLGGRPLDGERFTGLEQLLVTYRAAALSAQPDERALTSGPAPAGQRADAWQATQPAANGRNSSRSMGMSTPQWVHRP